MISENKNNDLPPEDVIKSENLFPVVGIGASAGGLAAFKKLLGSIPESSGMAYVLVQHLDPNHESMLPELLQKVTKIPVQEISDDVVVKPDNIYIIPSNKLLIANDGVLLLSPRPGKNTSRINMPIDIFFSSLAEIHQTHAIGVVLSGTATDGTLGLKAIKDHGGITFAQDEHTAEFNGMPLSAINAGVVDFVLPAEEIIKRVLEIKQQIAITDAELLSLPKDEEDIYKQTIALLRVRKGTDFTFYKQATIRRRILRRITLTDHQTSGAYLKYLRENKVEQDFLYQDLLIPVTEFFRDHKIFDNLCHTVFPEILKNKSSSKPIRVWLAGCSTGQEAYSVAICLKEFLGDSNQKAVIFATDISEPAIIKARIGIYNKYETGGMSEYRLAEHFTPNGENYQINKQLREMCVFAVHDFLKDPPFGNIDFLACRNVLIYMEPYLQKRALSTFHYALNPKGFLLLGKSESIISVPDLFAADNLKYKLFIRKDAVARYMHVSTPKNEQRLQDLSTATDSSSMATDFQRAADEILLSKHTPAGVVVNDAMDLVQFRGATSLYLEQSPVKPSHNLLKLAKPGLGFELRNILLKVKKSNTSVTKENIPIGENGDQQLVTIEAMRLPNIIEPHFLILFHQSKINESVNQQQIFSDSQNNENTYKDMRIKQLELELSQTREDMRSITEDQEATNEELQSANEELLSGSEELQSLNEELETGKEELQSTNEELTVMNQEMISLNEQLRFSLDYTDTIIATMREPLIVISSDMIVKSANKAFYKMFDLTHTDTVGMSIFHIGKGEWNIPQLQTLFREILPERKNIINYEASFNLPGLGERHMVLNASEMNPEKSGVLLILIVLEDVTERVHQRQREIESNNRFKNLVMQAPIAVCILNEPNYTVELANNSYLQLIDRKSDFVGAPLFTSMPELENQGVPEILNKVSKSGTVYYGNEVELEIFRHNKKEKAFFDFVFQPMMDANNTISGILVVTNEVTQQVMARKKMETQASLIYNLLMTAPGFVCTFKGPTHIYDIINERYQGLFGNRELKGKPLLEALPEIEGQGFETIMHKVYETGKPYVGIEIPAKLAREVDQEPELRYFNYSYQPMYDENDIIHSILSFGYEVTNEVNAKNKISELQFRHAQDLEDNILKRTEELTAANKALSTNNVQLVKMNKEMEAFNYISSHDLQEPLRKIQIFSGLILSDSESMSQSNKDYFLRIQSAAWRMQTLIHDLLSYSRVSNSNKKFDKINLEEIIKGVEDDLSEKILSAGATIEIGSVCELNVDPSQFRQLFNNLLGNALKFVVEGRTPHINIESTIGTGNSFAVNGLAAEKQYCEIKVSDNGIGFEPHYKDKVFELFQRLHSNDLFEGTGIGLAIVKKITENHNGLITVDSEVNKGTTFYIYIPSY